MGRLLPARAVRYGIPAGEFFQLIAEFFQRLTASALMALPQLQVIQVHGFGDGHVPADRREVMFEAWRNTPWLRWICLTKRVPNIEKMLPKDWGAGYRNVGLVATTVTQDEFDRDAPRLLRVPAAWHGFSMEPQLDEILLPGWVTDHRGSLWFITGGESRQPLRGERNGGERPYDPMWAFALVHAALTGRSMGKSWWTFVKQMGCKPVGLPAPRDGMGKDPAEWPKPLRVQDFPPELLT